MHSSKRNIEKQQWNVAMGEHVKRHNCLFMFAQPFFDIDAILNGRPLFDHMPEFCLVQKIFFALQFATSTHLV